MGQDLEANADSDDLWTMTVADRAGERPKAQPLRTDPRGGGPLP